MMPKIFLMLWFWFYFLLVLDSLNVLLICTMAIKNSYIRSLYLSLTVAKSTKVTNDTSYYYEHSWQFFVLHLQSLRHNIIDGKY